MENKQFLDILSKYIEGKASVEEQQFLYSYYHLFMAEASSTAQLSEKEKAKLKQDIKTGIDQRLSRPTNKVKAPLKLWMKIIAAACLLLIASLGSYLFTLIEKPMSPSTGGYANDIAPGRKGATLTLASGKRIYLTDKPDGIIAEDHGVRISKSADGQLIYHVEAGVDRNNIVYNTLSTARGETFKVRLPDQSIVFMNAASTLRYPTRFKGHTRAIEFSGEGYFEVTKNPDVPFQIITGKQTISVLGTHFNLNSYPDETFLTTTLLEGKVKVRVDDQEVLLTPGQQSTISNKLVKGKATEIVVSKVNTEDVVAWKNDWFQFNDSDIRTIMNQLSRWYNVEVVYQGKIPEGHYRGKVSRNVKISRVLEILKASGINFKIEGNTIIVK